MKEEALERVNALRVRSALTVPISIVFNLAPARKFTLSPDDVFDIREEVPLRGYLEISLDSLERPTLWIHEWESGRTEVSFNFEVQPLPAAVRNNNPELRLPGWPHGSLVHEEGLAVGLFLADTRSESTVLRVDKGDETATFAFNDGQSVWYSGTGADGNPPELIIETDGLRMLGMHSRVVTQHDENARD
ncbi:hypothetical protein [Amycolatopsis sp. NPDC059657]|uniref:hypothetical protein n=1 Tax=Amycolatopsis sp. NPDC059657 TaxID=3346899 RepID=UPI00366E3583